jgi:hypothetical protein
MNTAHHLYVLKNAADRLQRQANSSRGTVCDDDKVYGLELEAATIRKAIKIWEAHAQTRSSSKDG